MAKGCSYCIFTTNETVPVWVAFSRRHAGIFDIQPAGSLVFGSAPVSGQVTETQTNVLDSPERSPTQ